MSGRLSLDLTRPLGRALFWRALSPGAPVESVSLSLWRGNCSMARLVSVLETERPSWAPGDPLGCEDRALLVGAGRWELRSALAGQFPARDVEALCVVEGLEGGATAGREVHPHGCLVAEPCPGATIVVPGIQLERGPGNRAGLHGAGGATTQALAPILHILARAHGVRWATVRVTEPFDGREALDPTVEDREELRAETLRGSLVPRRCAWLPALERAVPSLAGKLVGEALATPAAGASFFDLTLLLEGAPGVEEVLETLEHAASGSPALAGRLALSSAPLTSRDLDLGSSQVILDRGASQGLGPMVLLRGWFVRPALLGARLLEIAAELLAERGSGQ